MHGPANVELPVCGVCENKPPSRAVRVTFSCGHTYHMGCHDGKYAVGTKTGDKLCAPCRGVQGAGPASASPLTPGADAAAPLVKRQRRHGSQEAGPGEEAEPSSGPATEQGAGAAAGSKRKRSTSPSQAQEATTEEQKAPTAEKQGRADKGSVKKKAHKPAAH